jgi:hypothetical protein
VSSLTFTPPLLSVRGFVAGVPAAVRDVARVAVTAEPVLRVRFLTPADHDGAVREGLEREQAAHQDCPPR